ISRDPQEADGGGLPLVAFRQGELPPQAFDANDLALVLDRLPKLLVDDFHLGRGGRSAVPYAGQAEEIARKLRAIRMDDEGSAHSEDSTEKAGLEDDIVSRRSLSFARGRGCRGAGGRPVVLSERERGEIEPDRRYRASSVLPARRSLLATRLNPPVPGPEPDPFLGRASCRRVCVVRALAGLCVLRHPLLRQGADCAEGLTSRDRGAA